MTHRSVALLLLLAVLSAATSSVVRCEARAYNDDIEEAPGKIGFVRREGKHLLDDQGNPFFIVGTNSYYLLEHASESEPWLRRSVVTDTLDAAKKLGLNTVRTWAFYDGKLQTAPGVYDEDFFDALDYVVAKAGDYDLKLVLSLTNYWDAYGGMEEYVKWAHGANSTQNLTITEFYTSPEIKEMYKSNFLALKNRFNSYTNLTYGEDPTILAWELANEPENPGDFSGKVLQSWIAEMSHFIKDNAPNQLVTSGSQGFFGPSTLQYMYLNGNFSYDQKLYTAQMCTGADFLANHDETTAIDLPSFHLYPDWYAEELCGRGAPASDCALQFAQIQTKVRLNLAEKVLGKPLYLGEFGKMKHPTMEGTLDAQVVYRNRLYAQVYKMIQESAVDAFDEASEEFLSSTGVGGGSTFWMLASKEYKDYDNFTVYEGTNGPALPPPWVPTLSAVATQSDFRNYREEQECVTDTLALHPEYIDAHWFVAGRDADDWADTVNRMDRDDPAIAENWYLDASTVRLIQNHASNMDQLARLNKWG